MRVKEIISIKNMPKNLKLKLIENLGYKSDGDFILKSDGKTKHLDKYTNDPVKIDNMFVFPGSTIILDNNPLSISSFLEEFGDVF